MLSRLRRILTLADPMPCELTLGTLALIWGGWLVARGHEAGVWWLFSALLQLLPAFVWGGVYVALGLVQILACLKDWRPAQAGSAVVAVGAWAFISAGLCYAPTVPRTPSVYTTAFYGVMAGWCYFRLRGGPG